jgi:F-type H+-transporting ATPase subunit b
VGKAHRAWKPGENPKRRRAEDLPALYPFAGSCVIHPRFRLSKKALMIELPNVSSLYVILAFGICYWILRKYLFVPLAAILDAREQGEKEAEKAYAASLADLQKAVAAGEERLAETRREALRTRETLRAEGVALLEKKVSEAQAAAQGSVEKGVADIEGQAAGLAKDLPERARALARELAERILGRKLAA